MFNCTIENHQEKNQAELDVSVNIEFLLFCIIFNSIS